MDDSKKNQPPQPATDSLSANVPARSRIHPLAACLLLIVVTLRVYCPVTGHEFVDYDDGDYVFANPHVQAGLTWNGVLWALGTGHASNWHPLTWMSHMLDMSVFGKNNAGGHHLTSVLFHCANSALVFLLLRALTGSEWRSLVVAALFAWHPLHVESVAWVSERKDVLSACFGLLTLLMYARYATGPPLRAPALALGLDPPEIKIMSKSRSRSGTGRSYLLA